MCQCRDVCTFPATIRILHHLLKCKFRRWFRSYPLHASDMSMNLLPFNASYTVFTSIPPFTTFCTRNLGSPRGLSGLPFSNMPSRAWYQWKATPSMWPFSARATGSALSVRADTWGGGERKRETGRDRERQRETERDRERQRETERDRERQRETERW